MGKIEKMQRYIELTWHGKSALETRYSMSLSEVKELADMARESPCHALSLAFDYGMTKGYRARKAQERRIRNDGEHQAQA